MNSLDVTELILETKHFTRNAPIAEGMGLKGGHLYNIFLYTL